MPTIMIKLLLLLGAALLALAATLPGPPVNSTLSVSAAPSQGGGFVKNCSTHSLSSILAIYKNKNTTILIRTMC